MKFYSTLLKTFFDDFKLIKENESDKVFEATFTSSNYKSKIDLKSDNIISFLNSRDNLYISIQFGLNDSIVYNSNNQKLEDYKVLLDKDAKFYEEGSIEINLTINKKTENGTCTIYDLSVYTQSLNTLTVLEFISIYSTLFESFSNIKFEVLNLKDEFYSNTISFCKINSDFKSEIFENRNSIIENFKSICHFNHSDKIKILPSDFSIIKSNDQESNLNIIFKKYETILSIIYLFDITNLDKNDFFYKINGYKSIKGELELSQIDFKKLEEYFEIYKWVYNGGNLNDKIGLARNIISLHFYKKGELELQGNPFQAIQSSYKVYEKQNIKQYIEIRNKISDQLIDFNNRANKIIDTFANGFQKSSLALISFYISAIAIKVLGKGEFTSIFTLDATILSISFLLGSFIYFIISRWELKEQRKRFVSSYENLKARYTDLLDSEDITRILNNDKEFDEDINFIDNKKKYYSMMWISILIILGSTTVFLFICYNLNQFFETYLFRLIFGNSCNCN